MKLVRNIATLTVVLYALLVGGLWVVMHHPLVFGQVMKHVPDPAFMVIPFKSLWLNARAGSLGVGDEAPDFQLSSADKKSTMKLSYFRGRIPVVLVFGSYT